MEVKSNFQKISVWKLYWVLYTATARLFIRYCNVICNLSIRCYEDTIILGVKRTWSQFFPVLVSCLILGEKIKNSITKSNCEFTLSYAKTLVAWSSRPEKTSTLQSWAKQECCYRICLRLYPDGQPYMQHKLENTFFQLFKVPKIDDDLFYVGDRHLYFTQTSVWLAAQFGKPCHINWKCIVLFSGPISCTCINNILLL